MGGEEIKEGLLSFRAAPGCLSDACKDLELFPHHSLVSGVCLAGCNALRLEHVGELPKTIDTGLASRPSSNTCHLADCTNELSPPRVGFLIPERDRMMSVLFPSPRLRGPKSR